MAMGLPQGDGQAVQGVRAYDEFAFRENPLPRQPSLRVVSKGRWPEKAVAFFMSGDWEVLGLPTGGSD